MLLSNLVVADAYMRTAAAQAGSQAISFNIRAQALGGALNAFADQAGLRLLFPSDLAAGRSSPGLSGTYSRTQGLSQLLAGTGLSYRFTSSDTVTINGSSAGGVSIDGAIQLDTIDVSGGGPGSRSAADQPFRTPGSVSYISREELDRIPPISTGDVFRSTPGVISAGGRSGISINPNIRGLQGMGRVNTTVDGARQTTSSYRGYSGNRDEVYVDPDMIGGIDISKGPSEGVGTGTIAGTINFRTLEAKDIIKDGNNYGVRFKGSLGGNTVTPRVPSRFGDNTPNQVVADRSLGINGDMYSGSFAIATIKENYEFIAAYSKREQGNYFVGTKVPDGIAVRTGNFAWDIRNANATVPPGTEAFNTSENTDSFLAKGKVKWGDGQSLELGYLYFDSQFGEMTEFNIAPVGLLSTYGQTPLSRVRVDTYTAKYRHNPSDNPLFNFRANLWHSDVGRETYGIRTSGSDIGNVSTFATPFGDLSWDNGAEVVREGAYADQYPTNITGSEGWMTLGPTGQRVLSGAFSRATLKPFDWLTISGGGRYDHYQSKGEGYLVKYPEKSGERFSPNADVVLTPFDGLQFYGQYKEGYRPPSLRESHWHYEGLLRNNPDLLPEVSKNKEVGVNLLRKDIVTTGDKLRAKFSMFDNHYDDYIFRSLRLSRGGQNIYHWFNMDSANFRGWEVSGGYDAGFAFVEGAYTKYTRVEYCPTPTTCAPPSGLRVNIGAQLQNPQQADYATNYIPPEWSGSLTGGVRLFDQKLTIGGRTHFASSRYGSVWRGGPGQIGYTMAPPGYRAYDIFGSYKFNEDNVLHFSIENVTDEYYFGPMTSLGMPSPGRSARLSYTATLSDTKPLLGEISGGNASKGAPGSDWTGLYLGGHLGYGLGDITGTTTTAAGIAGGVAGTESADVDIQTLTKGFQAGFNYQFANGFVVGLEAERIWLKHQKTHKALATEDAVLAAGGWYQATTQYDLDWMTTLRGRAGFAFDRVFVYGAGGVAWLKEIEERNQYKSDSATQALPAGRYTTGPEFREQAKATRVGWTAGGGFEYALTNNWSLKGEYAYAQFDNESFEFRGARAGVTLPYFYNEIIGYRPNPRPGGQPIPITQRVNVPGTYNTVSGRSASNELDLHSLKIGLNYRF